MATSALQADDFMAILFHKFRFNPEQDRSQNPALFLNKQLPFLGGNWCDGVSHCTPNDPTEATPRPKGSPKERLLNTLS